MSNLSFLKLGAGGTPSLIEQLQNPNWFENKDCRLGDIHKFFSAEDRWTGHYVEPHPYHIVKLIRRLASVLCRDQYEIYNCCIQSPPNLQLFSPRLTDITSIDVCSGLHHNPSNRPSFWTTVWTLQEFLKEANLFPNVIDMNIEGSEEPLIEHYDFHHKPEIWIIEAHQRQGISPQNIAKILQSNNYDTKFHPDLSDPHVVIIANLK